LAGVTDMRSSLSTAALSEIVEMALSDHISFAQISAQHGVTPDEIKAIMRTQLKPGSYRAWRKRVRDFGDRREHYK
jgi:uncharacterized protein (TIGR03643 family)